MPGARRRSVPLGQGVAKAAMRDARKPSQCGSTCPAGRLIACEDRGGRARRYWTGEDRNLRYYESPYLANLNPEQRCAAEYGGPNYADARPLLIIAGAG